MSAAAASLVDDLVRVRVTARAGARVRVRVRVRVARERQQSGGEDAAVAGQVELDARRLGAAARRLGADGVDAEERARRLGAGVGVRA